MQATFNKEIANDNAAVTDKEVRVVSESTIPQMPPALRERFQSMDQIIRFYFQLYQAHLTIDTSVIHNYQDHVFAEATSCPAGGKAALKFSLGLFYALADELSEGAAPFLKHRNDSQMGLYLQQLWLQDATQAELPQLV